MAHTDTSLLEAALVGYQVQHDKITAAIADIHRQLGGRSAASSPKAKRQASKKHVISPEGRARIAAAQRKRWAAQKKG
jgi:hypothetical protein